MNHTTSRTTLRLALLFSLSALALGCGDDGESTPTDAGEADGGPLDAGGDPTAVCDDYGLPSVAFVSEAEGVLFGDRAGDFTVTELDDVSWNFASHYSGCESYVFFTYFPSSVGTDDGDYVFESYPSNLFVNGPENVHYFFLSWETELADRLTRMSELRDTTYSRIAARVDGEELQQHWREHVHFVTDRATEVEGSVGEFYTSYLEYLSSEESITDLGDRGQAGAPLPLLMGIDRDQRFDAGGTLDPYVGGNPNFGMGAFLGHFFNHKAALDRELAESSATELVLVEGRVTDRIFTQSVTLPDLSDSNTFSVSVEVNCPARTPFQCSEWDRIAQVDLCVDGETCEDTRELVRWITPYWRHGRRIWEIDASPMIALLQSGSESWFRVTMGPSWERATERDVRVALRFSDEGSERASGAERAFVGGTFDTEYNASKEPFTFTPPATATRVEVVTLLSGHGQEEANNCAEWCDHRHVYTVNDTALDAIQHEGSIGSTSGCAPSAAQGLPPGQWGNWAPERAYWCPGLPVEMIRHDITSLVTPGAENTIAYEGFFGTAAPAGGSIDLTTYVVWYE